VKVCFLARSLGYGGAERQLLILASSLHRRGHQVAVVLFYGGGQFEDALIAAGVEVRCLKKRGRWDVASFGWRLGRTLRGLRPDVLYAYLTVPNIAAVLVRPFLAHTCIVWGLRASGMELERYDWLSRLADRLEAACSGAPDLIIVNSDAGRSHAIKRGLPEMKLVTIHNGIDLEEFRPDRRTGLKARREWAMKPSQRLIGLIARLDTMKDHGTFLAAIDAFLSAGGSARFVCVGDGPEYYRRALHAEADRRDLGEHIVWAGTQSDMPGVYNALDVVTLTSAFGEGFPNALGEAMACGVPCVATDVGDSAKIVGDTGIIVPTRNPTALAAAWRSTLDRLDREGDAFGAKARHRIAAHFGVETMITRSESLLLDLLCSKNFL